MRPRVCEIQMLADKQAAAFSAHLIAGSGTIYRVPPWIVSPYSSAHCLHDPSGAFICDIDILARALHITPVNVLARGLECN